MSTKNEELDRRIEKLVSDIYLELLRSKSGAVESNEVEGKSITNKQSESK